MQKLGGSVFQGTVFESIRLLTHAEGLIMARSTFSIAAMLLSEYAGIGRFYSFAYPWADIGSHWNCMASEAFESKIMRRWYATPEQLELLMTDTCRGWVYLRPGRWFPHHDVDGTPL
jgi:hypothetical protein